MIQRIQTVFLLLVIALCATVLFIPVVNIATIMGPVLTVRGIDSLPVTIIVAALAVIAAIAIMLYTRRPLQARICLLGGLFSLLFFVALLVFPEMLFQSGSGAVAWQPGTWIVIGIDTSFLLAMIFIRRDENLVRSADRIR